MNIASSTVVVLNMGDFFKIIHRALFVGEIHPTFPVGENCHFFFSLPLSLSLSLGAIFLLVPPFS